MLLQNQIDKRFVHPLGRKIKNILGSITTIIWNFNSINFNTCYTKSVLNKYYKVESILDSYYE